MDRQELKQLINELDQCTYQIPNIRVLVTRNGATHMMVAEAVRQLNILSVRKDEIQDILDASGEDIEALRNERL